LANNNTGEKMNKKYIISIGVVLVAVFYFQTKENIMPQQKNSKISKV